MKCSGCGGEIAGPFLRPLGDGPRHRTADMCVDVLTARVDEIMRKLMGENWRDR